MKFIATEAGFAEGLGGASNTGGDADYHYIVFGYQEDEGHPENSGIYFEYDDQGNSTINGVKHLVLTDQTVQFFLSEGKTITVLKGMEEQQWKEFLNGIQVVFQSDRYLLPQLL